MNSKKNKNRPNKPSNPNPPQKVEDVTQPVTEVQQIPEIKESVPKIEERVPELISDIPVPKSEEKADETPKKPKRNRGKKKNQDTEDQEPIPVEGQETESPKEQLKVEDIPVVPEVAPSARKKKNKGKKSSEAINPTSEIKEVKETKTEEIETTGVIKIETQEEVIPIVESSLEPESKSKKKNKKKKHRNDSEKSEKADELSCVAAFQKLLKDDKSDVNEEITSRVTGEFENKSDVIDVVKSEEKVVIPELGKDDILNVSKQPVTDIGKGKKKNKKDKKYPSVEEKQEISLAQAPELEVKSSSASVSISSPEVQEVSSDKNVSEEKITIDEDNVKSKAKIAKPVERKPKEKIGDMKKSACDSTVEGVKTEEKDTKLDSKQICEETTSKGDLPKTITPSKDETSVTVPSTDVILTKDTDKGKKGKKAPKTKIHDTTVKVEDMPVQESMTVSLVSETMISELELKEKSESPLVELKTKTEIESVALSTPANESGNKRKKSPKPKKTHSASETDETPVQTSFKDMVPESIVSELDAKLDEQVTLPFIETETKTEIKTDVLTTKDNEKSGKRKKSPKPNKQQVIVETDETPAQTSVVPENVDIKTEVKPEEKANIPLMEIKTKSESVVTETEVKPEETTAVPLLETETKTEINSGFLPTPDNKTAIKRKKSPQPKKQQLIADTKTDAKPVQESITVNVVPESSKSELEEKPKEVIALPSIEMEIITDIKSVALPTPDVEKRSKRKKSPKPKLSETGQPQCQTTVTQDIIENTPQEIVLKPEGVKLKDIIDIMPPLPEIDTGATSVIKSDILPEQAQQTDKKNKKTSKQKKVHQMVEGDADQTQKNIYVCTTDKIFIESEVKPDEMTPEKSFETSVKTEIHEKTRDETLESKTKKKGKKLPKMPAETKVETETPFFEGDWSKEEFVEDKTDISGSLPSQDDIEISSLKAEESEGSTCGVTPDLIQYPRATSQELIDDNNNDMVIQEITVIEETRLEVPVQIPDTPLICGSGETPLVTPEIQVPSTSTKLEQHKESEKTDIKSKMMEVNQDMEELRLSIERSLAELTSIEKNEEELEMEFADKLLVITEEPPSKPSKKKSKAESGKVDSPQSARTDKDSESVSIDTALSKTSPKSTLEPENKDIKTEIMPPLSSEPIVPPVCPARKDNKNKGKSKKKGKQETAISAASTESTSTTTSESTEQNKTIKVGDKTEQKTDDTKEKSKQQTDSTTENKDKKQTEQESNQEAIEFDPIENFEDAMTSSADDINKSFEMIANDSKQVEASHVNPEINIIAPKEEVKEEKPDEKINPVSQPKNLLGHPDIPVRSNRMDYKKEKNKSPNETLAKVKIKDSIEVETRRESKESQTDNIRKFMKNKSIDESFSLVNENDDFVYKYSFRRVFLQSSCHVCKKELKLTRVPCSYCSLVFYCSGKHKDEDWPQHQALCFAVSTISHLKDQKHIYADAKNITGQNYRLLRMQMIVSCEKVLKRRLVPWEQEALLYPRICADVSCREWRQNKLIDCDGCSQISYCIDHPDHFPKSHQRWCKSYCLYQKLVSYQQTKGRLEPKLPSKVIVDYQMPEKMNEVLASMYEEKIDMSDIQYAALTQIATAPLTAAYSYQMARKHQPHSNGTCKKTSCTIHVVDAELQFEADALNKWEVFFLHLMPVDELRVVMISVHLNPGNLPLELLSKIKLCEDCRLRNRRVIFNFQDKQTYYEYWASEDYITPNLVCAFNANIHRSSLYVTKDPWPKTINCILKQNVPFLITDHTLNEIHKDVATIKEIAENKYNIIIEPKTNNFASVRPDRNFISDDEMPLLFKNYCFALLVGVN